MLSPNEQFEDAMEVESLSHPAAPVALNKTMGNKGILSHGDGLMEQMYTNMNVLAHKNNREVLAGPPLDPSLPSHDEALQSKLSSSQPLVESKEWDRHDQDGINSVGSDGSLMYEDSLEKRSVSNVKVSAVKNNGAPHRALSGQSENQHGEEGSNHLGNKGILPLGRVWGSAQDPSSMFQPRRTQPRRTKVSATKADGLRYDQLIGSDVLCGRNPEFVRREGNNKKFYALANGRFEEYADAKYKKGVTQKVVHAMRISGGRFVRKDPKSGLWYQLSNEKAIKKAQQFLQQGMDQKPSISDSELTDYDVLCKSVSCELHTSHEGTTKFYASARAHSREYACASNANKALLAWKLVNAVHDTQGRFLMKDHNTGLWYQIPDQKAYKKARKSLRTVRNFVRGKDGISREQVTHYDVLGQSCGRTGLSQLVGTRHYRELVRAHKGDFASANDESEKCIARSIIDAIHSAHGCFLATKDDTGLWNEIDDKTAETKVFRALLDTRSEGTTAIGSRTRISTEDITDRDILCGHAVRTSGSKKSFNALLDAQLSNFVQAKTEHKTVIVRKVVVVVCTFRGRFLSKDPDSDSWIELTYDEALREMMQEFYYNIYRRSKGIQGGTVAPVDSISNASGERSYHRFSCIIWTRRQCNDKCCFTPCTHQ